MNIKQKGFYLIGTTFVTMGLLAGCGSDDGAVPKEDKQVEEQNQQNKEEKVATKEKEQTASEEIASDNVIEISAFEMGYTPPSVTLEEGKEYTLVLKNQGEIFHDLTSKKLDAEITYMGDMPDHPEEMSFINKTFGVKTAHASGSHSGGHDDGHGEKMNYIHMNAKSGQTVKIKFIPEETGEFKFYCSVPGHEEAGMHGKMEVE